MTDPQSSVAPTDTGLADLLAASAVATRDASLPLAGLLDQLRSARLHAWQPPGGGAAGRVVRADSGSLVALLSGRALPDGRTLPRRQERVP